MGNAAPRSTGMMTSLHSGAPEANTTEDPAMPHTHEFDCPTCGAHLDSREQLTQHRESAHAGEARSASDRGQAANGQRGSARNASNGQRETRLD
jgi:hypothetical protein